MTGLKVNNQLVACATRFLAVRLKYHVWLHYRTLNTKARYKRALAPPPNFEFIEKIKMADYEESSREHLVFFILVKSNKTYP